MNLYKAYINDKGLCFNILKSNIDLINNNKFVIFTALNTIKQTCIKYK